MLIWVIMRKMQIKTRRCYLTLVRKAIITKPTNKLFERVWRKPFYIADENVSWAQPYIEIIH